MRHSKQQLILRVQLNVLEEQLLDVELHDRLTFTCGIAALDDFFSRNAAQQAKKGVTVVYVLIDTINPRKVLGYYTLSAAQIDVAHLSPQTQKKLPRYPVPCIRLGRLAVSVSAQGKGIGKMLVGLAVRRSNEVRKTIAAYALVVDAKNESAKLFYQQYGFTVCLDSSMMLYLPLGE
jgi:ribosomal protein S18 acetylase RimI-like enzyme